MEGSASEYYALVTEQANDLEYYDLVRKLEKRFGFKDLPETAHMQFMQAKQKQEESLEEWADRILQLATRAFQNLPEGHMYQQVVLRLCQGGIDKEAGQYAANLRPFSIEDALDKIRWFQHTSQAIYGRPRKDVRYMSPERPRSPVSVNAAYHAEGSTSVPSTPSVESRLLKLEEAVQTLSMGMTVLTEAVKGFSEFNTRGRTQCRSYSSSPSPVSPGSVCYRCGGKGHFKRECPTRSDHGEHAEKKVAFKESPNESGSDSEA